MNKKKYNIYYKNIIQDFLINQKISTLTDLKIHTGKTCALIYPTDDLLLSKTQFKALIDNLSNGDKLYVVHMCNSDDLNCLNHDVYELDYPFPYQDYVNLDMYSISIILSNNKNFIIVIDESLEGGIGVMVSNQEFMNSFKKNYNIDRDIEKLKEFYKNDSTRNPNAIDYSNKLLSFVM